MLCTDVGGAGVGLLVRRQPTEGGLRCPRDVVDVRTLRKVVAHRQLDQKLACQRVRDLHDLETVDVAGEAKDLGR